jgi:DNA (cytosine-5)-methyltransferase 1
MRGWGYQVKVEVLNAEQYGVPQTRKRAILVARRGGPVNLPAPTHSKYYSRTPDKLDPGVRKWVSMAEALGWRGMTTRPSPTITGGGTEAGGAEPIAKYHERYTSSPGWTGSTERLTTKEAAALQSYPVAATKPQTAGRTANYGTRPDRPADTPAFTIVGHDGHPRGGFEWRNEDGTTRRLAADELSTLQTYERPFVWCGTKTKQFLQIGNAVPPLLAEAILSALIGIKAGR